MNDGNGVENGDTEERGAGGMWLYLAALSAFAVLVTVYDKWAARHRPRHRVRERTLWLIAALGGSLAMYGTMQLIRHKTCHRSFMIGLPLLIVGQIAVLILGWQLTKGDTVWQRFWLW